jgi:fructosamine-3-kinase
MRYNVTIMNTITFLNEPKFSEHEADAKFNERRKNLIPQIAELLKKSHLFSDQKIGVTFIHSGMASLVSILDADNKKVILKIPLNIFVSRTEGSFLKAWERVGVKVPTVIEEGEIGEHYYLIMEYVDEVTLSKKYSSEEILEKHIYEDLGKTLKLMHTAKTEGYGNLVNGKGEYAYIKTRTENDSIIKDKVAYIQEHELLNNEKHGSIDEAWDIIFSKVGDNNESSYCHNDFHIGNIFAADPLIVFDPLPMLNHPYMDLGRSIILAVRMGIEEVSKQIMKGYFENEDFDQQLLQAFLIVNVCGVLKYWHQTNRAEDIESLQKYLEETKYRLV